MSPRQLAVAAVFLVWGASAAAQVGSPPQGNAPQGREAPLSFKVLAGQVAAQFPLIKTEVVEVQGTRVILAAGRAQGVQAGLELSTYREGRELIHPTTKKSLGRTEEALGRVIVAEVAENYSVATQGPGKLPQPGDHARVSAGKARLTVVPLSTGVPVRMQDAAIQELVQELDGTGRFQVVIGDRVTAYLGQQRISPEDFLSGRGARAAQQAVGASHLLALHLTMVEGKPWMEVRLFSAALDAPLIQTALFVPPAVTRPKPTRDYSSGGAAGEVKLERRSLLSRLLSGDFEPNAYSSSAASIPIRQLAIFPFLVISMDVRVAPGDKIARMTVTDGQKVYLYRVEHGALTAEWTDSRLMVGSILSVQLADLDGDGVLEVVVNRQDATRGMLGYVLTTRNGRPAVMAEDISVILLAVDDKGDGIARTLWGQSYNPRTVFTKGTASRYVIKGKDVAPAGRVAVHDQFRPLGATFTGIAGKDHRVLAFVDERNRLTLASGPQELWRSLTAVGGGFAQANIRVEAFQTIIDRFVKMEPNPVAIDLDGDGVEEIVVAVNDEEAGRMAVIFRGPAGFRMQLVNTGFEGLVTGLGAISHEGGYPALISAVVKREGLLRQRGDTQILVTTSE